MFTNEEYEKIKQKYDLKELKIGVDLSLARKSMNGAGNKTSIIWNSSFFIMMIISFLIGIYSLGIWGILYGIIFSILLYSYIGICSINYKNKNISFIINIVGLVISFFFTWKISLLLVFTFFNFISVYLFYSYIGQEMIRLALNNKSVFITAMEEGIIIIKNNKG